MKTITFELWDASGPRGSIAIPEPSRWYYRWPLRFVAFVWRTVADAERQERECDICGLVGGHKPYCVKQTFGRPR